MTRVANTEVLQVPAWTTPVVQGPDPVVLIKVHSSVLAP